MKVRRTVGILSRPTCVGLSAVSPEPRSPITYDSRLPIPHDLLELDWGSFRRVHWS